MGRAAASGLCWAGSCWKCRRDTELLPDPVCCADPSESILAGSPFLRSRGGMEASPCRSHPCAFLLFPVLNHRGWTNLSCCSQPCEHHSVANSHCRDSFPASLREFLLHAGTHSPNIPKLLPSLGRGGKTDPGFGPGSASYQQRTAGSTNTLQGFTLGEEGEAAKGWGSEGPNALAKES